MLHKMGDTMINKSIISLLCLFSSAILSVSVDKVQAASMPIDVGGSSWELTGSLAVNAAKVGKLKLNGAMNLYFGPNDDIELSEGEFLAVDPEGDSFYGNYATDAKANEILMPDTTSLEDYIKAKIQSAATEAGNTVTVNSVEVTAIKNTAKPKSTSAGISMKLNMAIKANADLTVNGQALVSKVSISSKSAGVIEMTGAGSHWSVSTTSKASIKGLGKISDSGSLDLIFGPNSSNDLAENEFVAIDDESREFTGAYSVTNGKIEATLDQTEFENFLTDVIEDEVTGTSNTSVSITKIKVTAKIKYGLSINLKINVSFNAEIEINGEVISSKGSFSQAGTGVLGESLFISSTTVNTYYVDAVNGSDLNDGTEALPYKTISYALSVSGENSVIQVLPGTYDQANGEVFPLELKNDQTLIGDVANKGASTTPTVINGYGQTANSDTVTIIGAEDSRVSGIKIGEDTSIAGHMAIYVDGVTMEISDNTFISNTYGGVYLGNDGTSVVENNVFASNSYGVYIYYCSDSPIIRNNIFSSSAIPLYVEGPATNATISGNTITGSGEAGIQVQSGYPQITSNTFNLPDGYSYGAIRVCSSFAQPSVRDNTFICNNAIRIDSGNPDLGTRSDPGDNDFSGVTGVSITHYGTASVYAIGNIWPNDPPLEDSDILIDSTGSVIWGTGTDDYIWDSSDVIPIYLDGDSISVTGYGATVSGSQVTITAAGAYSISGSLDNGQIIVDSGDYDTVRLILNGADISCSSSAPVFIKNAEKTIIDLAANTENYVSDGRTEISEYTDGDEPNAVIFSKDDLTIYGDGALTVNGNYNDGIASKDGLVIAGGTIEVNAVDDGIRGKNYIVIQDGDITVNAGGDGLKSDNDSDTTLGYISIESGIIDIVASGDAIQAKTSIYITDGEIAIDSGGGSGSDIDESNSAKGIKANISVIIDGGNCEIDSADSGIDSDGSLQINGGTLLIASGIDGIHAETTLEINGGACEIESADDGIDSDGSLQINGGTLTIASDNDGIHAETTLEVNGGEIDITKSYEGIEGTTIVITDGDIYVSSSDDGITSGESLTIKNGAIEVVSDGDAIQGGTDVVITDGEIYITSGDGSSYQVGDSISAKGIKGTESIVINGGDITVDSADDAVHSDGSIDINGGVMTISSADDGIHAEADLVFNGGEIDITKSYEGLESADGDVVINDGTIHVESSDDGISVAGGGDTMGMGGFGNETVSDCYLYINGGYLAVYAEGDGLDSNGSIVMTDGIVIVHGPTSSANAALDHGSFLISGGTLVAVGSSGMAQSPDSSSSQGSVLLTFRSSVSAGTLLHFQSSDGDPILSFVPAKTFQSVVISTPELVNGTYDVYYGGSSTGTAVDGLYLNETYTEGTNCGSFTVSGY